MHASVGVRFFAWFALALCSATAAAAAIPATPAGCMVAKRSFRNATPVAIPSAAPAVVTSAIAVDGIRGSLYDVTVRTALQHARPEDLDVTLKAPDGTTVTLTTDNGGGAADAFADTVWSDYANPGGQVPYAANPGLVTDDPYTAPVPLVAPESALGAFRGMLPSSVQGTWLLTISDDAAGAGGLLNEWSLEVRATPWPIVWPFVPPFNAEPVAISAGAPNVYVSEIVVPPLDPPGVLESLEIQTFLRHAAPGDLDVTLSSPAGTVVTLTSDNGGTAANVMNGTVWSSTFGPRVTDHVFTSGVVAASLRTEEPLAAFYGEDPSGVWTLTVSDDTNGNGGSLDSWGFSLAQARTECASRGDFDFNGADDFVLRRADTNEHMLWSMLGPDRVTEAALSPQPGPGTAVVASEQFLGSPARADLVLQDTASQRVEFWEMEGAVRQTLPVPLTGADPLPANWKLSAAGDFNHDGNADLLWRNVVSQKLVVWTLGERGTPTTEKTGSIVPQPDQAVHANWEIVAALDFDGDNNRDMLWYNSTSGKIVLWFMDDEVRRTLGTFTDPPSAGDANWRVVAAGDYGPPVTGDGVADIVWRNATSGKLVVWFMNGATNPPSRLLGTFTTPDSPTDALLWRVVAPR